MINSNPFYKKIGFKIYGDILVTKLKKTYPILPLRNTVLFPHQIIPIYICRKHSLKLINDVSKKKDKHLIALAQEDDSIEADQNLLEDNYISIVPVRYDITSYSQIDEINSMLNE